MAVPAKKSMSPSQSSGTQSVRRSSNSLTVSALSKIIRSPDHSQLQHESCQEMNRAEKAKAEVNITRNRRGVSSVHVAIRKPVLRSPSKLSFVETSGGARAARTDTRQTTVEGQKPEPLETLYSSALWQRRMGTSPKALRERRSALYIRAVSNILGQSIEADDVVKAQSPSSKKQPGQVKVLEKTSTEQASTPWAVSDVSATLLKHQDTPALESHEKRSLQSSSSASADSPAVVNEYGNLDFGSWWL